MTGVLGLPEGAYSVVHYLTAERYVVLAPSDAMRLAEGLDEEPVAGRGSFARKPFLVKDHAIPVQIRRRAKSVALLSVYRITQGATFAYKAEVRLRGRRSDRHQFAESDIPKLDAILLDLITRFGLSPGAKPARWEPRHAHAAVDHGSFDPVVRQTPQKAWRGSMMAPQLLRGLAHCHRLGDENPPIAEDFVGASEPSQTIRRNIPINATWSATDPHAHPLEVRRYVHAATSMSANEAASPESPEDHLVSELARLRGALVEAVLPEDLDPSTYVEAALRARPGRRVGLAAFGLHTWPSLSRLMQEYPAEGADDIVVVVDPSLITSTDAVSRCVSDGLEEVTEMPEDAPMVVPGPLGEFFDASKAEATAMAAMLWGSLRAMRAACEASDSLVMLFTVDHRPDSGRLGVSEYAKKGRDPSKFTDCRFRSFIGDAGRYWAHQRYLVEVDDQGPSSVVVIKDEAEGRTGRHLWVRRGTGNPTRARTRASSFDPEEFADVYSALP